MKRNKGMICLAVLLSLLCACGQAAQENPVQAEETETEQTKAVQTESAEAAGEQSMESSSETETEARRIQVQTNENTIIFELNDSQAARDLYEQLPLTTEVENFSTNEKIFYPPQELDVGDAPLADAGAGTLAYYAPWGDVVMFYDDFGAADGLYELGQVVSGNEYISGMSGTIQIEQGN